MFTRLPARTAVRALPRRDAPLDPEWLVALRASVRVMSTDQRVALLAPLQRSWPASRCMVLLDALRGELDAAQWDELARRLHALQAAGNRPQRTQDEHAELALAA